MFWSKRGLRAPTHLYTHCGQLEGGRAKAREARDVVLEPGDELLPDPLSGVHALLADVHRGGHVVRDALADHGFARVPELQLVAGPEWVCEWGKVWDGFEQIGVDFGQVHVAVGQLQVGFGKTRSAFPKGCFLFQPNLVLFGQIRVGCSPDCWLFSPEVVLDSPSRQARAYLFTSFDQIWDGSPRSVMR